MFYVTFALTSILLVGTNNHSRRDNLTVIRNLIDEFHYEGDCRIIQWAIRETIGKCACKEEANIATIMSPHLVYDLSWLCLIPSDLEPPCHISIGTKNDTVHTLVGDLYNKVTTPLLNTSSRSISEIKIWNILFSDEDYDDGAGYWDDNPFGSTYFHVNDRSEVSIAGFNHTLWSGHLFKIEFGGGECAIVKVSGSITYPFVPPAPTTVPPTHSKPTSTTIRTTTAKNSTITTRRPTTATESASTTTKVPFTTGTVSTGTPVSTITPTKTTPRKWVVIVGFVAGVIILVTCILIIGICRYRSNKRQIIAAIDEPDHQENQD